MLELSNLKIITNNFGGGGSSQEVSVQDKSKNYPVKLGSSYVGSNNLAEYGITLSKQGMSAKNKSSLAADLLNSLAGKEGLKRQENLMKAKRNVNPIQSPMSPPSLTKRSE